MRRRSWRAGVLAGVVVAAVGRPATADGGPRPSVTQITPPLAARVLRARKALPPPEEAFVPSAAMTLHITPAALGTPWTMEVTNVDSSPLRLVSDARLLMLDVTQPSDTARNKRPLTVHCALPVEIRPTDDDKARVLLPRITLVETFDPRLYCFDAHDAAALVPGAELVARFGWASTAASPPFVADAIDGGEPRTGVKELTAVPVMVPDEFVDDTAAEPPTSVRGLRVSSAPRIDAETGRHVAITVTVENTTSRTVRLLLRPETVRLEVASPRAVHQCGWPRPPGAPIAEVFTSIPPHGKASTEVQLSSMCPDGTVDSAGLYTVLVSIDTRHASGRSIGIQSFDEQVAASKPSLVRVRRDRPPRP